MSIIIAAVMALLAVVMVNAYLNREKEKYRVEHQMVYVVVATQDIPKGTTIEPPMVATQTWPQRYLQPKALENPQAAVGKIALGDIMKGEQILATKLTIVREVQDSLAVRLPQGKRAYSMKFENPMETTVAQQVKVGDYVDIIGVFPYQNIINGQTTREDISVTLFQKILVMGIQGVSDGIVFTFALTPEETAILTYAKRQGSLRLVLRHPLDAAIEKIPVVEANVLWNYILRMVGQQLVQKQEETQERTEESPAPQPQPAPPPTLEIYRGTKREEVRLN